MHSSAINNNRRVEQHSRRVMNARIPFGGHSSVYYCVVLLLLIWIPGCASGPRTDPLAGWHVYMGRMPPQITDNYQEYIKNLPERERQFAGPVSFFKDDSGRIAVKIEIPVYGTWKDHILIYDSAGRRLKVIRYNAGHYMS